MASGVLGAASIPFMGCVTLLLAIILHILAFASPFWAEDSEGQFGLWRVHNCNPEPNAYDNDECYQWNQKWDSADWLLAVRGLECLTILFWSIPLVVLPVYIYVALGLYYRCLLGTMTCFTLLGAICNIVGVIIFGIEIEDNSSLSLRWCLPVCAIGGVLGFISFIIFVAAVCKRPKFEPEQHFLSGFYVDPVKNRMYVVESDEQPVDVNTQNGSTIGPAQVNPVVVSD